MYVAEAFAGNVLETLPQRFRTTFCECKILSWVIAKVFYNTDKYGYEMFRETFLGATYS